MTNGKTKRSENQVQQVKDALAAYAASHPKAKIDVRAQNPVSIRIRILDPSFQGIDRADREPAVWKLLKTLPDEVVANVTMLLLLTPQEAKSSLANIEFDDPVPSRM